MSLKNCFKSKSLQKLYQKGQLDGLLRLCKNQVRPDTFIGAGGDASGFHYSADDRDVSKDLPQVIKICSKDIIYFKHFRHEAQGFYQLTQPLAPQFLPPRKIIYDDQHVFAYVQDLITPFQKKQITLDNLHDIFQIAHKMISHNLNTNLASHNLAFHQQRVVVFDYHAMIPIKGDIKVGHIWWKKLIRQLGAYLTLFYRPEKVKSYEGILDHLDQKGLQQLQSDAILPPPFLDFLQVMIDYKTINKVTIVYWLQECLKYLQK